MAKGSGSGASGRGGGRGARQRPVSAISVPGDDYLTSREKQVVREMLNQGAMEARSGRTNYQIQSLGNDSYRVRITRRGRGIGFGGELTDRATVSRFTAIRN